MPVKLDFGGVFHQRGKSIAVPLNSPLMHGPDFGSAKQRCHLRLRGGQHRVDPVVLDGVEIPFCPIMQIKGFGALLGAQALNASRAIAVSPQSSIDPDVVRFERRYGEQWAKMDGWRHDLAAHMDDKRAYTVMVDPMHGQDKKHEGRLPKPAQYSRVLLHGAGHAGIQSIVGMGQSAALFNFLRGDSTPRDMRNAYRAGRRDGFRYIRKMGVALHDKKRPAARMFYDIAREKGFHRLLKKWDPLYE